MDVANPDEMSKAIGNYENHEKLSSEKIISELFFENEKHTLKGEQFLRNERVLLSSPIFAYS